MKIDTAQIEGFDKMTPEQKLEALTNYEYEDHSTELAQARADNKKQKDLIDKYSSQIADQKKQLNEKLTEDERASKEIADRLAALEEENGKLLEAQKKAQFVKNFIKQGYEEGLAEEKAEALIKGDMDKVFDCEIKFNDAQAKKIKAEVVKGTSGPNDKGDSKKPKTKAEIMAIKDPVERQRQIAENMDLFKKKEK